MMDENKRSNPAELANERMQEIETAKASKQLNDAMNNLSKENQDQATKEDLFKAMHEITKQVKLNESKQIDSITSAAIQTALDVSMQMKSLDDPRLRRQAMITLRTINDNIKLSDDSSTHNVDEKAVKRNVNVAIDDLKGDSLLSKLIERASAGGNKVENAIDESGPLFGLMKDVVKSVATKVKSKQQPKPEVSFLDHQIQRNDTIPEVVSPVEVKSDAKGLPVPKSEMTQVVQSQPAPIAPKSEMTQVVQSQPAPIVHVDFKELTAQVHDVKEADESILSHIKDISASMKEQLIFQKSDRQKENAKSINNNFRKFKVKPNAASSQQPEVKKQEDGGGLLDMVTPLLFGGKGILSVLTRFLGKAGVMILSMLNPKNILKFAKGVVATVSNVIGKIGGLFDDIGGVAGKLGKVGKLGKLAKGIPFIGTVISIVMGIFDFFDSFANADEVLGKAKDAVTLWDRVSAGIGGLIGGIVGIADAILGIFGIETDMGGFAKKFVAEYLADIPNIIQARIQMFKDVFDGIVNTFTSVSERIKNGINIVADFLNDVGDFISNLGPTLKKIFTEKAKAILNTIPGGLGDKLFPEVTSSVDKQNDNATADQPKPENAKPENPGIIQRALSALPSLSDIFGSKETKEKAEKEQAKQQAANVNKTDVNNFNNVNSTNNTIYQSQPISTRPADDSFRIVI